MNNNNCTVLFTGGLGNQLFQFVFMLYQEKVLGFHHAMWNRSSYGFQPIHSGFQADCVFDFSSFTEDPKNYYSFFFRLVTRVSRKSELFKQISPIIREPNYKEGCRQKVYEGFWQKYKYYEAVKDVLPNYIKDFTSGFPDKELMRAVLETQSVFIHVRRGDYLKASSPYYDLTKSDYYSKANDYIREHMENPVFYVFSDDIKWCKAHFGDKNGFIFAEYEGQSAINDLALMNCCRAAIIANSSFSWWGAALKQKELVLYSPQYFRTCAPITNSCGQPELYPNQWIEINHKA